MTKKKVKKVKKKRGKKTEVGREQELRLHSLKIKKIL